MELPQSEMRTHLGRPDHHGSPGPQHRGESLDRRSASRSRRSPGSHLGMGKQKAWAKAIEMLAEVRMPDPEAVARRYAHQLSGGMLQRVLDRDRPDHQPAPADHGRADHRARRDDRGGDPRPGARFAVRVSHRGPLHHPQPRRRRRASATGSASCTRASSWKRDTSARYSSRCSTPTHWGCWAACQRWTCATGMLC